MVKRLVSFGCSLMFGAELADTQNDFVPSKHSFAALIAQHYGVEHLCLALPGSSNETIERCMVDYFRNGIQDDYLLIGWTSLFRTEYLLGNDYYVFHTGGNPLDKVSHVIQPTHDWIMTNASMRIIAERFSNLVFRTERVIKSYGLRHTMMYSIAHNDQPRLDKSILALPDFRAWAYRAGYKMGPHGHPLEHAHADYAKILLNYISL